MITAQTSPAAAPTTPTGAPEPQSSPAAAIHAQADRVDQLSAAILRATAQVSWSGRAADQFRARAAERARECLQLAVALRASAERVHAAAVVGRAAGSHAHPAADPGSPGSSVMHGEAEGTAPLVAGATTTLERPL